MSPAPAAPSSSSPISSIRFAASAIAWSGLMPLRTPGRPTHEVSPPMNPPCFLATVRRLAAWNQGTISAVGDHRPRSASSTYFLRSPSHYQFIVELRERVTNGELGAALFNAERQLMWPREKVALGPARTFFLSLFRHCAAPGAYNGGQPWIVARCLTSGIASGDDMLRKSINTTWTNGTVYLSTVRIFTGEQTKK